jgi:hypothetical protein
LFVHCGADRFRCGFLLHSASLTPTRCARIFKLFVFAAAIALATLILLNAGSKINAGFSSKFVEYSAACR